MTLTLIGDATVALLLVATIAYVGVLNRRLAALRDDKAKLEALIQGLNVASQSAEAGIAGLRQATDETGKDLEKKIAAGQSLRDDLTYLIERGGTAADRLEGTIRARREEPQQPQQPQRAAQPERPILAPVRAAAAERPAQPERPIPAPIRAPTIDDEKVTQLRVEPADQLQRPTMSRSERNLLRALGGRR